MHLILNNSLKNCAVIFLCLLTTMFAYTRLWIPEVVLAVWVPGGRHPAGLLLHAGRYSVQAGNLSLSKLNIVKM